MNKQLNSHQFESVYKSLGINLDKLGCIMLTLEDKMEKNIIYENELYTSTDKSKYWIKGYATPHLTLLYGLLKSGQIYKRYVDKVLEGWSMKTVTIDEFDFFESQYEKEPYYCIIAKMKITPELLEGHQRLQLLPHIDTFPEFKPHMTVAYIKKIPSVRNSVIRTYNEKYKGKKLTVKAIDYGGKPL